MKSYISNWPRCVHPVLTRGTAPKSSSLYWNLTLASKTFSDVNGARNGSDVVINEHGNSHVLSRPRRNTGARIGGVETASMIVPV